MTANVRIVVEDRPNALKVPNAALRWRPAGVAETRAPPDAPREQAGGAAVQQFRARLIEELKPSEAQKARLEDIFADSRQKLARVREVQNEAERRRQAERVRAETNARIAELLTPEQRPAWERLLAESGGRGASSAGRVYVVEAGAPKAIDLRLGFTDGTATEVLTGGLAEGSDVIVGVLDPGRNAKQSSGGGLPRPRFF
jgi:HlyD family secretion protein